MCRDFIMESLDNDKEKLKGLWCFMSHVYVCMYVLQSHVTYLEIISSFPQQLSTGDIDDFCSLAEYYAARTPQSFRKVSINLSYLVCVCVGACACTCVLVHACVCVCVCAFLCIYITSVCTYTALSVSNHYTRIIMECFSPHQEQHHLTPRSPNNFVYLFQSPKYLNLPKSKV